MKHTFKIAKDLIVPDADNSIAERHEVSVAMVIRAAVGVLPTINFNDDALFSANKINVIPTDRLLTGKL